MMVGLIEWDGSYTPTVIIASSLETLNQAAVRIVRDTSPEDGYSADGFLTRHPYPDLKDTDAVTDWLVALREENTIPYFTVLEPHDLVLVGDPAT